MGTFTTTTVTSNRRSTNIYGQETNHYLLAKDFGDFSQQLSNNLHKQTSHAFVPANLFASKVNKSE